MSERPSAPRDRVLLAVVALSLLALLARAVLLGDRPFHWAEGRVGYWTLRFLDTGGYEYHPTAGGPFLHVVNRWLFAVVDPTDASARAVVALVGGLLPLSALLFRGSLRDGETVALAGLLAADPLLLYYSRFLRGDLPAAAFGLVAVGGVVRYRDSGAQWGLYLAAAAFALALAASGFAAAYPVVWLAAGLLVLDESRVRGVPDAARERLGRGRAWLVSRATPLARALFVFLAVALFFFAPRAAGSGVGLWNPATFPAVVTEAFVGAPERFVGLRFVYRIEQAGHPLLSSLAAFFRTLAATAWPLVLLGLVGFALERYAPDTRGVVAFGAYAGGVGLFVFPVASMRAEPWSAVHVLPWLALPAAVGLARVARGLWTRATRSDATSGGRRPARVVAVVLVVTASLAAVGATTAGVYAAPASESGTAFAQFAQPADDLDGMVAAASAATAGHDDGPDVVYVGADLDTSREYDSPPVLGADRDAWGARLPLQWYFERLDADTSSVRWLSNVSGSPPVVVTVPDQRVDAGERFEGYREFELRLGLWDRTVVVFVAPDE
ncbi:flippase activity-associated protein Agl23 [Candidatus Halobonum tyrrellensis]|uniref:TIGR03663 family protein n=1 Tax=Candidatus Halobonum tyrrellensis G22 TaxID=1324957 RepID=V4HKZ1_9EURY|nr:flippase activity-associated protein Agl23 [Candidatus Halobonum tyrrellensis]ESP88594.1 hypothetical protein K933_09042 [Candidatus Halobonum tyrrellensis G22]